MMVSSQLSHTYRAQNSFITGDRLDNTRGVEYQSRSIILGSNVTRFYVVGRTSLRDQCLVMG
jgi:hypothetical protein